MTLREFFGLKAAPGIVLFAAAALAMIADNSALAGWYESLFDARIGVGLVKPLRLWINDGLMAVFFLLVGLELKREMLDGELSKPSQIALPAVAALCGMIAPAAIYALIARDTPGALSGWAIPAATDIAFALGVLALLGDRIPPAVRLFLTAVAVLDDLGAIIVIAVFYTDHLSGPAMAIAAVLLIALAALNRFGVTRLTPYLLLGAALWLAVLESGVHATLAGVAVGLAIPLRSLKTLTHALHPWVEFGVLPIFAFANSGIPLAGLSLASLVAAVPLGIAAGLFVGKQIGILAAVALVVGLRWATLPAGTSWTVMYGVALLCGIGFTMSLFIGSLAFNDPQHAIDVRLGVMAGSLLSAALGYAVLRVATRR